MHPTARALIVVAHPDDEALGCGGTAPLLVERGYEVFVCVLSGQVSARKNRPSDGELLEDMQKSHELMGVKKSIIGAFPNIKLNTVAHLELVQFIESAVKEVQPNIIFTHHAADVNDDHVQTSLACQAAARLFQRGVNVPQLEALYFMEILSATDWALPHGKLLFTPTVYFDITNYLDKKIAATRAYRGVMREHPHPRSVEGIRAQAMLRGAQAGVYYAEAFQLAFSLISANIS